MFLFVVNTISLILYCGFNSYYNYNRPRERHSGNFISLESQYLNVSKENKLTSFPLRVLQSLNDLFKSKQKNTLEGNIALLLMFRVFLGVAETIVGPQSEGSS